MPRPRLRASRANQTPPGTPPLARLPTGDLPPRLQRGEPNVQLRRLQEHQRHLEEMERLRRERQERVRGDDLQLGGAKADDSDGDDDAATAEEEKKKLDREAEVKEQQEEVEAGNEEEEEEEEKPKAEEEVLEERRRDLLTLQLQQQQQELQRWQQNADQQALDQRKQIRLWQQELEEQNRAQSSRTPPLAPPNPAQQAPLLSPSASSALGTIYEAMESEGEEEEERGGTRDVDQRVEEREPSDCKEPSSSTTTPPPEQDYSSQNSLLTDTASPSSPEQEISPNNVDRSDDDKDGDREGLCPPQLQEEEVMSSLELDWGSKAGLVQQLISQTLLLTGQRCPPLLLVKGGSGGAAGPAAGGTLSPLESSLWPQILLPPLSSNPAAAATVTAVSSFAPETQGSSAPQGEWTVVEVETHH